MKDDGPRGEFARYAYGWSDKKPWTTMWILIGMVAYIVYRMIESQ